MLILRLKGGVYRGIISVLQNLDVELHGGTKVEEAPAREPSEGESSGQLHPCLAPGKDDRRFGAGARIEQQPEMKKDQKMERDTDSPATG